MVTDDSTTFAALCTYRATCELRLSIPKTACHRIPKDVPRNWFVKETSKKITVVVGYENSRGEFFFDADEIK